MATTTVAACTGYMSGLGKAAFRLAPKLKSKAKEKAIYVSVEDDYVDDVERALQNIFD